MLIYEKNIVVNNTQEHHIFGTMRNIPSVNDNQLVYRDGNGNIITPVLNATYVDDGNGGILERPANTAVDVFLDDVNIIPGASYVVKPVAISADASGMTTTYNVNETLDTNGLVVKAFYSNGVNAVTNDYTTTPANNTVLNTAGNIAINVNGINAFTGLSDSFNVTVA